MLLCVIQSRMISHLSTKVAVPAMAHSMAPGTFNCTGCRTVPAETAADNEGSPSNIKFRDASRIIRHWYQL